MDWIEEKLEKTAKYIRNMSFRKAMIAYILVLAVVVFLLSYLTMILCWQWELSEWVKYESEELERVIFESGPLWGYDYTFAAGTNSERLLFLCICRNGCDYTYFLSQAAVGSP